jgi:hypothetical protein
MKTAVFYATREGHARRVAERVAADLRGQHGDDDDFDVRVAHSPFAWPTYQWVCVVASVHGGHHEPEMIAFVIENPAGARAPRRVLPVADVVGSRRRRPEQAGRRSAAKRGQCPADDRKVCCRDRVAAGPQSAGGRRAGLQQIQLFHPFRDEANCQEGGRTDRHVARLRIHRLDRPIDSWRSRWRTTASSSRKTFGNTPGASPRQAIRQRREKTFRREPGRRRPSTDSSYPTPRGRRP